jgi:hypothetical protein
MWSTVASITSGITLVAFFAALGAWLYKASLIRKENLLKVAPEAERARLVESALEFFHVDSAGLTKQQQFQIVMEQIRLREKKYHTLALVVAFVVLVLGVLSAIAIYKSDPSPDPRRDPAKTEAVHASKIKGSLYSCSDERDEWWHAKIWKVRSNDPHPFHGWHEKLSQDDPPHNAPVEDRNGILAMHPPEEGVPAIIQAKLSSHDAILSLEATGSRFGDTVVQALANGLPAGPKIVVDGKRWYTLNFRLPREMSEASVEIRAESGGEKNWMFETLFIDSICMFNRPPE